MKVTGHEVAVVAGRWNERPLDGSTNQDSGQHSAAKGELFVFLAVYPTEEGGGELLDPSASALSDELRRRLAAAYYRDSARSVTASLGQALQSVNDALYAANGANPPDVRRFAAVGCVVAREGEVFIALVGTAVAHVAAGSSVESFAPAEGSLESALVGSEAEVSVEYAHRTVDGPAVVVLGSSSLTFALPNGQVGDLLSADSSIEALDALRQTLERRPVAVLSAAFVEIVQPDLWRENGADGVTAAMPPTGGQAGARKAGQFDDSAETPAEPAPRRSARRARRARSAPRLLVLLGAAIVAALLFYAFPVRLFLDYQSAQAQQSLVQQAQAKEQEARVATDSAGRIRLLVEASVLARRAAQDGRGDASTVDLDKRLQTELDTLTTTQRLDEPARLASLDSQPVELVLGASDLFVLDRGGERVLRYPLEANRLGVQSTGSPVVFRKGDKLGEQAISAPQQIIWMPGGSGRTEAFLILDSTGALYEWDPSQGLDSRFSKDETHAPLIAGYAGTLYSLNATDDQLEWRPPSSGVYDQAAYPYFQPDVNASVADVVSLAVAEDLYALRKSGQIDRFTLGKPSTFASAPPDRPLAAGSSISATARGVYAFDPANRRIVQFARDGTYVREFVLEGKEDLVDVALDEGRGLIYALGPQGIYLYRSSDLAALPPAPTPAATAAPTPASTPAATPSRAPSTPRPATPRPATPRPATATPKR